VAPVLQRGCVAALAFGWLGGCTLETNVGHDDPDYRVVARVPDTFRHELDVLFVVDDTAGMAKVHAQTRELWARVRGHLAFAEGGFPSVRIGVISSDVGVLGGGVPGCSEDGDRGALRAGPSGSRWLEVDPDDLAAAEADLAARLDLGEDGCAYEQPLAAMRRALDGSELDNVGFLREDAALGVVIVAGEDDCSIVDPAIFDDGDAPAAKFRCFREGVRCGGDDVYMPEAGAQIDCAPSDTTFLTSIVDDVAFVRQLKKDTAAVVVTGVVGDPEQVALADTAGGLALSPACGDGDAARYPGVRLGAFIDGVNRAGARGTVSGLCSTAPADAGVPTGLELRRALGHRCLEGHLVDVRPDDGGLQPSCDVHAIDAQRRRWELAACPNPNHVFDEPGPCYAIKPGPSECGDFPSQLALQVNWGGDAPRTTPEGVTTEVTCLVDEDEAPSNPI